MKQFLLLFTFLISQSTFSQDFELRTGDLLFQDLDCGETCDAIESVTQGVNGARLSHVGIVIISNEKVKVLEAYGDDVMYVPLNRFLYRYFDVDKKPKVLVGRIDTAIIDIDSLEQKAESFLGAKYDDVFDIENDQYYCSELVYELYKTKKGENAFQLFPMTYKASGSDKIMSLWTDYFLRKNTKVPEGEPGLNPGGISRSKYVSIVYVYGKPDGYVE